MMDCLTYKYLMSEDVSRVRKSLSLKKACSAEDMNLIIVSVADKNPINQEALRLLVLSILQKSPLIYKDFFFLYPTGEVEISFVRSISALGVRPISYRLDRLDDPYRTKFLLSSFLMEWHGSKEYCLYLDPDHIIMKPLSIKYPRTGLWMSSEVKSLSSIQTPEQLVTDLKDRQFNNSIVLGHIDTWREVLANWEDAYRNLTGIIPTRSLEEVAFSVAAKQANVDMRPIASDIQGNFCCFNTECSLFHYGGDNPVAMHAKKIIGARSNIERGLVKLRQGLCTDRESWFLDAMIGVLSHNKELV